jgi:hypothetical protein
MLDGYPLCQEALARSVPSLELSELPEIDLLLVEPVPRRGERQPPQGNPLSPYQ